MEAPFIHRCGQATTLQYVAAIRPVPRYHFATISTDVSGGKDSRGGAGWKGPEEKRRDSEYMKSRSSLLDMIRVSLHLRAMKTSS